MGQTSLPGLHGWITFFLLSGECFSCLCYYMFAATLTEHRVRFQVAMQEEVVVITPINILLISGCECWSLMKIKLMLLPNQHIVHRGRRILMRWWSWCDDLMMMMMMMMLLIMTVVSVEQSPGRGVHVSSPCLLGYFSADHHRFYLFIYLVFVGYCRPLCSKNTLQVDWEINFQNNLAWTRRKAKQNMHEHMYISFFWVIKPVTILHTYIYIYLFQNTHVYIQTYYRNVLHGSSKILLNLMETAATISRLACGAVVTLRPKPPDPTVVTRCFWNGGRTGDNFPTEKSAGWALQALFI